MARVQEQERKEKKKTPHTANVLQRVEQLPIRKRKKLIEKKRRKMHFEKNFQKFQFMTDR